MPCSRKCWSCTGLPPRQEYNPSSCNCSMECKLYKSTRGRTHAHMRPRSHVRTPRQSARTHTQTSVSCNCDCTVYMTTPQHHLASCRARSRSSSSQSTRGALEENIAPADSRRPMAPADTRKSAPVSSPTAPMPLDGSQASVALLECSRQTYPAPPLEAALPPPHPDR